MAAGLEGWDEPLFAFCLFQKLGRSRVKPARNLGFFAPIRDT
jgi:hypothetical protein